VRWLRFISLWGPVVAFMVLVYTLADQEGLPATGRLLDKALHAAAYALFGGLCLRAFHGGIRPLRRWPTVLAMLLTLAYGAIDEWHQVHVPGRHPSLLDWLADAAGAGLALGGAARWSARRRRNGADG
jgi:VanZ family protein